MFAEPPLGPVLTPVASTRPIWHAFDALIGIGILIGSLIVVLVLFEAFVAMVGLEETGQSLASAALTIGFDALFAGGVLALARLRRIGLVELGFRRPGRWAPLGIIVVGTYATFFAYGVAILLLEELGVDVSLLEGGNEIPINAAESTVPLVALLALFGIAVVAAAPLAEELLFRGLLFRALDGVWAGWAAIAVSGIAFGAFHLNLSVLIPFSVIGMLFAWAFKASGSLWVTVIAHFIINSVSFIVTVMTVIGVID